MKRFLLFLLWASIATAKLPNFTFPDVSINIRGSEVVYSSKVMLKPIHMQKWVLTDSGFDGELPWYECLLARTRADLFDSFEKFKGFFDESFVQEIGGSNEFEKAYEFSRNNLSFQHYQPEQLTVFAEHWVKEVQSETQYVVVEFVQQHEQSMYFNDRDIIPLPHSNVTAVSFIAFKYTDEKFLNHYIEDDSFLANFKNSPWGLKGILSRYQDQLDSINSKLLEKVMLKQPTVYSGASEDEVITDLLLGSLYER